MSEKSQALLVRVTRFYHSFEWLDDSSAAEWLALSKSISELSIQDAIEAFEKLYELVELNKKTAPIKTLPVGKINPLDDTYLKLRKVLTSWFWTTVIMLDFDLSELDARQSIIDLVAEVPHNSKVVLMQSPINGGVASISF